MTAKKLLSLALAAMLLLSISTALAASVGEKGPGRPVVNPTAAPMTMYVVTDNGRGLNVRSSPYQGNNIIGLALYGSKIDVLRFLGDGWACILWNQYEAYVQSRYLQWYAPAPVVPTAVPTEVTPFIVTVTPVRTSGWVNLRWAPSIDTEVMTTYRYGAKLTVLAETQSWYQVVDPDTEATGFIMKTYVTRQY